MKKLHQAVISHRTGNRFRLKFDRGIPDISAFFTTLKAEFEKRFKQITVNTNPFTGSVLLQGTGLDESQIKEFALKTDLFELNPRPEEQKNRVAAYFQNLVSQVDGSIRKVSGQQLDMSGSVFLILVIHAVREIARGNLSTPSWFTALWFASTLFTRDFNTGNEAQENQDQENQGSAETAHVSDDGGADA